ncbi:MAG: pilus assembly protein N-terminal domain-containing protein [Alphaproteobacteria bacterium]
MNAKLLSAIGLGAALCLTSPLAAEAETNTMFILDGSNSMWGRVDGAPKIDKARELLTDLLGNVPADMNVGLMSYGQNRKADCTDVEVLSPIGEGDPATWAQQIAGITPKGKTPIALSLEVAGRQFDDPDADNTIVLVSDGVATCKRNACEVATALAASNVNVTVHVVGYDVNADEREQLQCIAEATGGQYFHAGDTKALKVALSEASQIEPTPPAPVSDPADDALRLIIDKSHLLRLTEDAATVMVANPGIADVVVESPRMVFLVGRDVGETNLIILDSAGKEILETPLVVVPNPVRQVTIHRNTVEATLSCMPRCAGVPTPLNTGSTGSSGTSGASGTSAAPASSGGTTSGGTGQQ